MKLKGVCVSEGGEGYLYPQTNKMISRRRMGDARSRHPISVQTFTFYELSFLYPSVLFTPL